VIIHQRSFSPEQLLSGVAFPREVALAEGAPEEFYFSLEQERPRERFSGEVLIFAERNIFQRGNRHFFAPAAFYRYVEHRRKPVFLLRRCSTDTQNTTQFIYMIS
jgi:hypothetical protein